MRYSYYKSLGLITRTIAKKVGEQLEAHLRKNAIDIKAEQWSVLSMLKHKKESSQKHIALEFGYDKVMVMRIIRSLEEQELVAKRISKNDKRTRIVKLTDRGHSLYDKIEPFAKKTIKDATHTLTDREIEFYLQISEKIIENLNE